MKIKAKNLVGVLKAIGSTSFAKKATTDIEEMNSVNIGVKNGALQIFSTNSRICAAVKIPDVDGNFSYIADNTTAANSIDAATDANGEIEFRMENGTLLAVGNATVPIAAGVKKESRFRTLQGTPIVSVLAADLVNAIEGTLLVAKKGTDIMAKVKMKFDTQAMCFSMLAFAKSLMASANVTLEDMDDSKETISVLVDGFILSAILPLLKYYSNEIVDIYVEKNGMMISSECLKLTFNCSSEEFVQCEKLLQNNFASYVKFNVKELKKQINVVYKAVKDNISFSSDGTTGGFHAGSFNMAAKFLSASAVNFTIPMTILKDVIGKIVGETVTISVCNEVLIKIDSEDTENIVYIIGGVK